MLRFSLPQNILITPCAAGDACYRTAVAEAARLLRKIGRRVTVAPASVRNRGYWLCICAGGKPPKWIKTRLSGDAYEIRVNRSAVIIASATAKGVLNGVYDLAERLGYLFLFPGEKGEWLYQRAPKALSLPAGRFICQPRFRWRGVFHGFNTWPYTEEEWLRYYAKLRFNAVCAEPRHLRLAAELGLRLEIGGHGLATLLPRRLFNRRPDLFRMFQPEDFGGKRQPDSNLCPTNPQARAIVKRNFRSLLRRSAGIYAIHAWPDDLPGSGWCLCSRCRAYNPADQSLLAMRILAEAAAEERSGVRIPAIAYHDTIPPPQQVTPPRASFLLYAPRERCYGHALDDPRCRKNRWYLKALRGWLFAFRGISRAQTFEYYFDQILFRGLYPFLPTIILQDMRAYQRHSIAAHMSLQVGGPLVAPEYNMLVFARGQWEKKLTASRFSAWLAQRLWPVEPKPWRRYLVARQRIFENAMRMCEHSNDIYLDYRWLPETISAFGAEMAATYARAGHDLRRAASDLRAAAAHWPAGLHRLACKESQRALFEAAELEVMAAQQEGLYHLGHYHNGGSRPALAKALRALRTACVRLARARRLAQQAGLPRSAYYFGLNRWLRREISAKLRVFGAPSRAAQAQARI